MDEYINNLKINLDQFFKLIKNGLSLQNVGILVSGGIDSSIIADYVSRFFTDVTFLSFGTKNNRDYPYVRILQNHLKKHLFFLEVSSEDLKKNLPVVKSLLKKNNIPANLMQISLALGYFLIFKKASSLNIKTIFTGQGPDIIFAGYRMYKNIPLKQLNNKIAGDLPLLEIDKRRDLAMAEYFGIKLINPYLDKEFINFSLSIPPQLKLYKKGDKVIEKYILRQLGKNLNLPTSIINRKKMAFQYSTKIQDALKKLSSL